MKYPETERQRTADGGKINATIFQLQKLKTALYCKRAVGRLEELKSCWKGFETGQMTLPLRKYKLCLRHMDIYYQTAEKRADRE